METFINFYFWWLAFWMIIQAMIIAVRKYPYIKNTEIGTDIFIFIYMGFFFIWLLLIRLGVIP